MGLDIYAGPLTRYYAGLWKTVVQQAGEAEGFEVRLVHPGGEPEPPPPAEAVLGAVLGWQAELRQATGLASMHWTESPTAEYFTDKPDWDGYWAIKFLAAADEFPDVAPPKEVPPPSRLPDPSKHPLMRRVDDAYHAKGKSGGLGRLFGRSTPPPSSQPTRYRHLLLDEELWLPVDFEQPFTAQDVSGQRVSIGSSLRLLKELEGLNERTLQGDSEAIAAWRLGGPPETDCSLERVARFGLAILLQATRILRRSPRSTQVGLLTRKRRPATV